MRVPSLTKYISLKGLDQNKRDRLIILYHSWVLWYLLDRVYKEFVVKSRGGTDSLGVRWEPLSENRRIYKPLRRGELPGRDRRRLREGRVSKRELLADRDPPINVDTGRLLSALKPGKIIGGEYTSINPDQEARADLRGIHLYIAVEYADDVQERRPFLPGNWEPWLSDAVQKAILQIQRVLT